MSGRSRKLTDVWRLMPPPLMYAVVAAAVGTVASLVIPPTFVVHSQLAVNSPAQVGGGASLLTLAQQFGIGLTGGTGSPDVLVALFTSEDVLEEVVQTRFPRSFYADVWFTDCPPAWQECDPIHIWRIDGKNDRDTLERAARKLSKAVDADVNPRSGIISLSVRGRTPQLALGLARRLLELVDSTNVELQREQARNQFRFMREQVESARATLRAAEDSLADFDVANRSVQASPMLMRVRGRLQRNVSLAESFYVQLTASLDQLYVAAANNVSTIGVVESPRLPGRKDWPKRTLIVLASFVLGLLAWLGRRHGRAFYEEIRLVLTRAAGSP